MFVWCVFMMVWWCFCGGGLWRWCFCGGVFVAVFVVVVFLKCLCGGVFVAVVCGGVFLWCVVLVVLWSGDVFRRGVVVFLWWWGGVFVCGWWWWCFFPLGMSL